jgi:diguanylate cyclase (GGDEF)-like protein/PAS domain S-box-containing protein
MSPLKELQEIFQLNDDELFMVIEQLPYATGIFDNELQYIYYNKAGEQMSGVPLAQAQGKTPHDILPPSLVNTFVPLIERARDKREVVVKEIELNFGDAPIFLQVTYSPIIDSHNNVVKIIGITQDITVQKNQELKLESYAKDLSFQADHDYLTELPNRHFFFKHLNTYFTKIHPEKSAILYLDLNRFKELNDTLGHSVGDEILQQLGERLSGLVKESNNIVARIGGDEFAFCVPYLVDEATVIAFANTIVQEIKKPFELESFFPELDASIGIAIAPIHGEDAHTLMKHADIAMYRAKSLQHNIAIYDESLNQYSPKKLEIISSVGHAIENDELELYYQPIIDIDTNTILSFEALLRWDHPKYGMVPPNEFIPILETSHIIHELSQWVLETALKQIKFLQDQGFETPISINLSAKNLLDEAFSTHLHSCLEKYSVDGKLLKIEVTEHTMMMDSEKGIDLLHKINRYGSDILIDDYGTGFSSLAYLTKLPVSILKIDIVFIRELLLDKQNEVIVASTILMAHNLGLKVVAEGIEEEAILTKLHQMGCDYAQGYYIAKPMPANNVLTWIKEAQ